MEKVYILILNWNNWKDTIACIESVGRQSYKEYQIILADNDSTDGSVEKIVDFFNNSDQPYYIFREEQVLSGSFLSGPLCQTISGRYPVILVRNSSNHGFGKGNNVGLKLISRMKDSSYTWLLNNDTVVDEYALSELMSEMNTSDSVGVAGSVLIYHGNPSCIQAIGGGFFYPVLGLSRLNGKNQPTGILQDLMQKNYHSNLSYIMGASMLLRKSVLEKVGFFDEDYFLYSEELDLCHRIKKAGYKLSIATGSWIYHKDSSSVKDKRYFYFYQLTRGNMIFLKKHFSVFYQICSFLPILFSTLRNTRDVKNLKYALKGYLEGLQFKCSVSKS